MPPVCMVLNKLLHQLLILWILVVVISPIDSKSIVPDHQREDSATLNIRVDQPLLPENEFAKGTAVAKELENAPRVSVEIKLILWANIIHWLLIFRNMGNFISEGMLAEPKSKSEIKKGCSCFESKTLESWDEQMQEAIVCSIKYHKSFPHGDKSVSREREQKILNMMAAAYKYITTVEKKFAWRRCTYC
uniref:AlNc14C378G11195 protein n=1 Tax=Albugo laibachii Nc14 TaxID=890382 RepID=F0WYD5_9STRA|nr:AlNc14C378G11195 [Albugo laibachii Nc14]|eukprot:CCA26488.1 AlNc14C378G11195 [Albugo laibachii Nc14]